MVDGIEYTEESLNGFPSKDIPDKIDFKIKAKQFVKLYGQLACIMPFANPAWE
jgi:type I restriction enzyme R subunit